MTIFKSFQSTVTPFHSRRVPKDWSLLSDPVTGAPTGMQNPNANGADGIWTPIDLTAAQIASPTALMIADLNAVYRLNVAPYTRYYSDGLGLVAFAGGLNTVNTLAMNALEARWINCRISPLATSQPAVTYNLAADATLTNSVIWNDADAGVFNYYGGTPTTDGVGGVKFPSTTVSGVYSQYLWRLETVVDAIKVQFRVIDISGAGVVNFIVDGQYLTLSPPTPGISGTMYVVLDFTRAGGRKPRNIILEAQNTDFVSAQVLPTEGFYKPGGDVSRVAIVGDSFTAAGGMIPRSNGYAQILADLLGIRDIWNLGVGSTGYLADSSGTQLTFRGRISDLVAAAPDLIILAGGRNDSVYTSDELTTECLLYFAEIRAQSALKHVPIIVLGSFTSGVTDFAATETAIFAAVTTFNDALMYVIPDATNVNGAWITGSGNTSATTGVGNADVYIGPDGVHPNNLGHFFLGSRIADDIMRRVFQANSIQSALSATVADGYGIQGPSGLFGTMIVYSPFTVDTLPGVEVRGTISVRDLPA